MWSKRKSIYKNNDIQSDVSRILSIFKDIIEDILEDILEDNPSKPKVSAFCRITCHQTRVSFELHTFTPYHTLSFSSQRYLYATATRLFQWNTRNICLLMVRQETYKMIRNIHNNVYLHYSIE